MFLILRYTKSTTNANAKPNFNTQKGISKKLQPLRKGPYQIIAKPTDVTYKITDSNKKENV